MKSDPVLYLTQPNIQLALTLLVLGIALYLVYQSTLYLREKFTKSRVLAILLTWAFCVMMLGFSIYFLGQVVTLLCLFAGHGSYVPEFLGRRLKLI